MTAGSDPPQHVLPAKDHPFQNTLTRSTAHAHRVDSGAMENKVKVEPVGLVMRAAAKAARVIGTTFFLIFF